MNLKTLPRGWAEVRLGDVAEISTGTTPPASNRDYYGGELPFIKPSSLLDQPIADAEETVSTLGEAHTRIVPSGAVFVSCIGNLGKTGLTTTRSAFNQQINAVVFSNMVVPRFGFYACQLLRPYLESVASATTISIVNKSKFSQAPIRIAPLPEQHRIVAEIETQLTRLDAAVAALERSRANLKRYRAAVLKAACEGRLVPTEAELARVEGREYEPASELLQRDRRRSVVVPHGIADPLPEGWLGTSIGELFSVHVGATPSRAKPEFWNGDIPWVSSGEVAFRTIRSTRECITEEGRRNSSTTIHPVGTVLIGMIGEGRTRGQVAMLGIPACNNQNSAAIRVSEAGMSPEYVYHYLTGQYEQTRQMSSGNNQPALNKRRVGEIPLPLPPLVEQRRIAAEVERLLSVVEEMERAVKNGLKRAAKLRRAILRKAFAGELVPQDPSDEPASVLLERIRAERATSSENGRGARNRRTKPKAAVTLPLPEI